MGELEGKIAVIAGGSSGIGLATAKRCAHLFITGRREVELAPAVNNIGKNVKSLKGDVSTLARSHSHADQRRQRQAHIVFANAGIVKYAALGEITEETANSNGGSNE